MVEKKLQDFINKNEKTRKNVIKVIEIFDELEKEEKEKISTLFSEDSNVSRYFHQITGVYDKVIFDETEETIKVEHIQHGLLDAKKLSAGAYDELYFSIRLALGEKLLKGEKGFFILDDPFIKADPERLETQINMLKDIAKSGWQVIYFSAKGEVKDLLNEDINKGEINYIKIKSPSY